MLKKTRRKERKETHTKGRRERGKEVPEEDWREKENREVEQRGEAMAVREGRGEQKRTEGRRDHHKKGGSMEDTDLTWDKIAKIKDWLCWVPRHHDGGETTATAESPAEQSYQ